MKVRVFLLICVFATGATAAEKTIVQKPAAATTQFNCTRANFSVWLDPTAWKTDQQHSENLFNLQFLHVSGLMVGVLAAEAAKVDFDSIPADALRHMRAVAPDTRCVSQETRVVSGREVLCLSYEGHNKNVLCVATGYYYTGPEGTVQSVVIFPKDHADKCKQLAEDFLNGLQIGKGGEDGTNRDPASPISRQIDLAKINATTPYEPQDADLVALKNIRSGYPFTGVNQIQAQAEKGDLMAELLLALLYDEGKLVSKDPEKSVKWMKKAADGRLPRAENSLATWYNRGHSVPKDQKEAERLFSDAASKGLADAQCNLASIIYSRDPAAAAQWFRKAADQNYPLAEYNLSLCYRNGTGVPKDWNEEVKWLRKASSAGLPDARKLVMVQFQSSRAIISSTLQTCCDTPASIAGVTRKVW